MPALKRIDGGGGDDGGDNDGDERDDRFFFLSAAFTLFGDEWLSNDSAFSTIAVLIDCPSGEYAVTRLPVTYWQR